MEIDVNDSSGAVGCLFIVFGIPLLLVFGALERQANQLKRQAKQNETAAVYEQVELSADGLPVIRWRECYHCKDQGAK